ncbi:HAMP domain-containing protein [Desulfosporosinus fructosivorans]|uniref:histidine kinase n=1 Tax=Desulfosporosinus fructosivorans TaxID=2018669 RepID=A0A4Z0QZ36_9FIRM|nr:ATP-binding protein [Desulfosporosinus fructosivorans]TGE35335.1 HAMP domain-containing protein [Desulfosporosinus fructosivorans]
MDIKIHHSWSISSKLWLAITVLILAVLGGLGLAITWLFGDFYLQQKLDSLGTEAAEISAQLATVPSWSARLKLLETFKLTSGTQLVLLDPKGNILVISDTNTSQGPRSTIDGYLKGSGGALFGGWSRNLRPSDFFAEEYLVRVLTGQTIKIKAFPVDGGGQTMLLAATPVGTKPVQGVVLLGSSPIPIQESIATFRWLILYASLIAVFLAAVVSLFFARQVTRPLALMQRGATRMAKGNFLPIQGVTSDDELGELAEALNSMGESLENHMEWLSQEKNLLQGIVESISDAVVMLSSDGIILYANDTAKALWQENETELQERKAQIINFLQTMNRPNTEVEKFAVLTLGMQVLQVVMAPMSEEEGIRGHVAVLRDITASLRSEKARREFLASVTHELRTPLHLIQGYLEAIQDDVIPENQRGEYVELVLDEAKRLARLVTDLQDINWLERGQSLQRVSLDLDSFMNDIEQRFQGRAQELGINFEVSKGSGELFADPDRLLQVFMNLLDNAMGHTPRGKSVRVLIMDDESQVRLAIQDEGEGIPKEALPFIFDRFFRVNKARSRKDGGMGLGLAIVRQIVEAHGGTIKVESDMGKGTIFWITLPRMVVCPITL